MCIRDSNNTGQVFIAGGLNARVGNPAIENVIGLSGESPVNSNGLKLREFGNEEKLKITINI